MLVGLPGKSMLFITGQPGPVLTYSHRERERVSSWQVCHPKSTAPVMKKQTLSNQLQPNKGPITPPAVVF